MAEFFIKDQDLAALKDKVVIITGGSSGIGLATVDTLLSNGAFVVNADINPPTQQAEGSYTFVRTDVAAWADQVALFKKTKETYGRIDHVFANAGIGPRANYLATEVDENGDLKEPTHALLDISLKGVMHTATLAIYHMRQQPAGGSIVINGSSTGLQRLRAVDYGELLFSKSFTCWTDNFCSHRQTCCTRFWKGSCTTPRSRQTAYSSQHSGANMGG